MQEAMPQGTSPRERESPYCSHSAEGDARRLTSRTRGPFHDVAGEVLLMISLMALSVAATSSVVL